MFLLHALHIAASLAVIAFHTLFDTELEVAFHEGGDFCNRLVEFRTVFRRKLRQNPIAEVEFRRAFAHTKADARELVAYVLNDIAQPVLAAVTAVLAATDAAHVQIDIVAEHQQVIDLDFVPRHQRLYRFAREVHVRLRLDKEAFLPRDVHLHGERLVFAFPVLARISELFDRHETGVMVRIRILRTGISETNDKIHIFCF